MMSDADSKAEVWHDSTAFLRECTGGMQTGQMIHPETFSLHRAMSSLELMDPKMDPGMNRKRTNYTFDTIVVDQKVSLDPSLPDVISIIDDFMCQESTWRSGFSMADTIFTCLYAHKPDAIESKWLKAYLDAALMCCLLAKTIVKEADIFEEEDFIADRFDFGLGEAAKVDELVSRLSQIESELTQSISKLEGFEKTLFTELLSRFRFRKALFQTHIYLGKPHGSGIDSAQKFVKRALKELANIKSTTEQFQSSPAYAFDPDLGKQYYTSTPPRAVKLHDRSQSIAFFQRFFEQCARFSHFSTVKTFDDAQFLFYHLAKFDTDIVTRSHAWLFISAGQEDGDFLGLGPLQPLLQESIEDHCASARAYTDSADFTYYVSRVAQATPHVIKLFCMNRSRQRRRVTKLLSDWCILQQEASILDGRVTKKLQEQYGAQPGAQGMPSGSPFMLWASEQTNMLLCLYLELGIELELFSVRELLWVYWYLTYLYQSRRNHRMLASINPYRPPAASSSGKGKNKRKNKKKQTKKITSRSVTTELTATLTDASYMMCTGVLRALQVLIVKGLLPRPDDYSLGSPELTFQHRFAPLMAIPAINPLTLLDYNKANDLDKIDLVQTITTVDTSLRKARETLTKLAKHPQLPDFLAPHISHLTKICVFNSICTTTVDKAVTKITAADGTPHCELTFDGEVYPRLAVVKRPPKPTSTESKTEA